MPMKTKMEEFSFTLPNELIALTPNKNRDHCRLLVLNKKSGQIKDEIFYNILNYLNKDDLLVFNNIKVDKSRTYAKRSSGGKHEITLISSPDLITWKAMTKKTNRLKIGEKLYFSNEIEAQLIEKTNDGKIILNFNKPVNDNVLENIGILPLPPYIQSKREYEENDEIYYQTVYAKHSGAKAAPTAGLHFTNDLLNKIQEKGIETAFVGLKVSLGTFEPIKTEFIDDHKMHEEKYFIDQKNADIINGAIKRNKRIIAVGTTVVRTLESSFNGKEVNSGENKTKIFIKPGFQFKVCRALITNFHTPESTLLLLVSAFAKKENIKKSYRYAIENKYYFFSYGDAMFIY